MSSILGLKNLYSWAMSQELPVNDFEWIKDTSQFNEDFIKNYNEECDEGYLLELDVQYLKKLHKLHNDLPFLPKGIKIGNIKQLVANLHDKNEFKTGIKSWISFLKRL